MIGIEKLELVGIKIKRKFGRFDLVKEILQATEDQGISLRRNDILIISSKFASMAEGRFVALKDIRPLHLARKLGSQYDMDPRLAQLILDESEAVLGGVQGYVLAMSNGILAPNGGIDRSNVPKEYAILYPKNPALLARQIRKSILVNLPKKGRNMEKEQLGVILSDSRVTPTRLGTVGVAVSASGFSAVLDFRGHKDLFGNKLKVTFRATADQLASAAELLMGEADESVPVVVARGASSLFKTSSKKEPVIKMTIGQDECLYIQSLRNPFNIEI